MAFLGLVVAFLVLVCDQASKWWAVQFLADGQNAATPVTGWFNLVLVMNHGVSFGMLSMPGSIMPYVLGAVAIGLMAMLLVWLWRARTPLVALALGLVIGGAAGNLLDRVRHGAVVDFLDFHVAGWHWPAFNVADAAICCGVCLLLWDSLVSPQRKA